MILSLTPNPDPESLARAFLQPVSVCFAPIVGFRLDLLTGTYGRL